MLEDIVILKKCLNGKYQITGVENALYDLAQLASHYPSTAFVVFNEEKSKYQNVFTKSQILKACGLDDELNVTCPLCSKRCLYSKSMCKCGTKLPHYELLTTMLGDSYKEAYARSRVESFCKSIVGSRGRSFVSYNAIGNNRDSYLEKILQGYKRIHVV